MSNIVVKFVGGDLHGQVRELPNAQPMQIVKLLERPSYNADPDSELKFHNVEYWMIPQKDGTWKAFEKPVWDEIQSIFASQKEEQLRQRRRAHAALDELMGW